MSANQEDTSQEPINDSDCIEVSGRLSRTDWEAVYFLAREFAQKHGLTVEGFELKPAKLEDPENVPARPVDAQEAATDPE